MSLRRSWIRLRAEIADRPELLSSDLLRQADVKEYLADTLRTDVFSTASGQKDFDIKINEDGPESVTVEFSDRSRTEDVLDALRKALVNGRVLS